jgi:hypothetical protein
MEFLQLLALFTTQAKSEGIEFIIWTFYRSPADQNYLYQQGRTRPGKIITNCDGHIVLSEHQKWLAVDILVIKDGAQLWDHAPEYDRLGEIWEGMGGVWGGRWHSPGGDIYHFELGGE